VNESDDFVLAVDADYGKLMRSNRVQPPRCYQLKCLTPDAVGIFDDCLVERGLPRYVNRGKQNADYDVKVLGLFL
jgi:hypothetical protein